MKIDPINWCDIKREKNNKNEQQKKYQEICLSLKQLIHDIKYVNYDKNEKKKGDAIYVAHI